MKKFLNFLLEILLYSLSYIPLWIFYLISDACAFILCYVIRYRKKIILSNLTSVFPEKDEKEIKQIVKGFYKYFCDLVFESLKALTISPKQLIKRFKITNPELLDELKQNNESAIIYAAHYGNWEWFGSLPLVRPYSFTALYQEQTSQFFDELILRMRSRFGVKCVESKYGYKTILQYKRDGIVSFNLIIGDQCPYYKASRSWVQFLGKETAFLKGAEVMASKTGQVLLFPFIKVVKRGYYEVTFIKLTNSEDGIKDNGGIKEFARALEENIRYAPQFWLWSHRRWKLKKREGEL
ncbi:lysophospholipid acyltransferase family protein [Carboxylicivirga caseinilyticus]|uniref:lysophospholipid acyltransferase family protein n=1 Tax=Carboxylicivirga caseinilyticus TaxID=3417572 RepID=UPI003D33B8FC|nr:lysophospholipid acyltransferase family protein [Marinilabiliaceae bacterium A049]